MSAPVAPPLSPVSGPPSKEITVELFKSLHEGFGDADDIRENKRVADYNTILNTPLRYNRVHGSIDARWPGQIRMGMQVTKIATVTHDLTPVFGVEWIDVVNNLYPAVYYLVGKKIMKIRFGTVTEVGSNVLTDNAVGGMLDDNGSGVPYLYASFGGFATNPLIKRMDGAGTVTTSSDVRAGLLLSLNGKAYRTIFPNPGYATCQVSVCPYGSDRFTAANWGNAQTVGYASTSINVLTAVRQAPVAIKPEGIYAYNAGLDQWVSYTPSWRQFIHLDNGKGAFFLGDTLVVPMGDGGAFIFDGNNARPFDPGGLLATPNVHTTRPSLSATAALRHWLVGATKAGAKQIFAGTSLRFLTEISAATFVDGSSSVRDADLTSKVTFTATTSSKIWVGWDRPFTTIKFDNDVANTNASVLTAKIGQSGGGYASISVRDFTALAGASLGQAGFIIMQADPVIAGWVKTTVNGISAYWVQLTFSANLSAGVTWLNCLISPWYPSVDPTNFPLDGLDRSGALPHLIFGRAEQSAQSPIWHDMASLSEPDDIGVVLMANIGGTSLNYGRNVIAIGRFGIWRLDTAGDDRPGTTPAPFLNNVGLLEGSSQPIEEGYTARLKEIIIEGHEMDPALVGRFYYSWDYGRPWVRIGPKFTRFPAVLRPDSTRMDSKGHRIRWAVGFSQASAAACLSQPVVTRIKANLELRPQRIDDTPDRPLDSTLPRF